jgi:hypothetical protein
LNAPRKANSCAICWPQFTSELDYLDWFWKNPTKPDRLRVGAAKEVAKYRHAILKATAKVMPNDFAAVLDRAKERVARANVIKLQVLKAIEHDAAELKPDVARPSRRIFRGRCKPSGSSILMHR